MEDSVDQWFAREILVHEKMLTRFLLRGWPARHEVPDLRQDVYVRVYEASTRARPVQPKAFLFATAKHLMIDRLRRGRIIFIGAQSDIDHLNVLVDEVSPEHRATSLEELQQLADAFDTLPPQCRTVMWLRRVEQLSQKEVAAKLGVREKAIEKQVSRGMRLLTSALLGGVDAAAVEDEGKPADGEAARG